MLCGNFILPEPASYVSFFALFNLRNLLYLIESTSSRVGYITVYYTIFISIGRHPVPQNLIVTDGVPALGATITCVALNGIYKAALNLFYDARMV